MLAHWWKERGCDSRGTGPSVTEHKSRTSTIAAEYDCQETWTNSGMELVESHCVVQLWHTPTWALSSAFDSAHQVLQPSSAGKCSPTLYARPLWKHIPGLQENPGQHSRHGARVSPAAVGDAESYPTTGDSGWGPSQGALGHSTAVQSGGVCPWWTVHTVRLINTYFATPISIATEVKN